MSSHMRQPPYGFAEKNHLPQREICREFRCSFRQIARWREELGLEGRPRGQWKAKPCVKIDPYTGEELDRYPSMYEAAISVSGAASNIAFCMSGKTRTAYGYQWKEVKE